FGGGISQGLNSPETLTALRDSGDEVLNHLASQMQGYFEWVNGRLQFVRSGTYQPIKRPTQNPGARRGGAQLFSLGGFVGDSGVFNNGPTGTDTVPAWLTPGEFVLRRAVAQAIPSGVLNSLNSGDPRIIGLLTSLNQTRPASPQVSTT